MYLNIQETMFKRGKRVILREGRSMKSNTGNIRAERISKEASLMCSSLEGGRRVSSVEYRYSVVSGMEAYLRWSLERGALWPERAFSFMQFTVSRELVHVSVTEVGSGRFETHQWIFPPTVSLDEVSWTIGAVVPLSSCRYVFTPGRRRSLPVWHLGACLTRDGLERHFPHARRIYLSTLCRVSPHVMIHRIGGDVRRHVEALGEGAAMSWYGPCNEGDALTTAVESDSAAILRLIVTPGYAYLERAA